MLYLLITLLYFPLYVASVWKIHYSFYPPTQKTINICTYIYSICEVVKFCCDVINIICY